MIKAWCWSDSTLAVTQCGSCVLRQVSFSPLPGWVEWLRWLSAGTWPPLRARWSETSRCPRWPHSRSHTDSAGFPLTSWHTHTHSHSFPELKMMSSVCMFCPPDSRRSPFIQSVIKQYRVYWCSPVHVDLPVRLAGDVDVVEVSAVVFGVSPSEQQLTAGLGVGVPDMIKTFKELMHHWSRELFPV